LKEAKAKKPRGSKKAAKAAKDPNAPKRPPTAFFLFLNEFRKSFKEEHPDVKGVTMVSSWICFYCCFSEFQSLGLYYNLLAASQLICLFFPVYFSFDIIFQPVTACFPFGYRCVVAVCSADFLSRLAKLEEKSGKT
jgi:hypothetical protein